MHFRIIPLLATMAIAVLGCGNTERGSDGAPNAATAASFCHVCPGPVPPFCVPVAVSHAAASARARHRGPRVPQDKRVLALRDVFLHCEPFVLAFVKRLFSHLEIKWCASVRSCITGLLFSHLAAFVFAFRLACSGAHRA